MKYLDFLNGSRSATNCSGDRGSAAMRKNNGGNTAVYRKIAGAAVIGCLVGLAAYHATLNPQPEKGLSDVQLANIEALASGETSNATTLNCWHTIENDPNDHSHLATHKTYCGSCEPLLAKDWCHEGTCVKK